MYLLSNFNRLKKNLFIYLFIFWWCHVFITMYGLSLVAVSRGYSLVKVHRLLIVVASLVAEHRLLGVRASELLHTFFVAHWHVIFPHQGLNPCPLHWQLNSQSLDYQASPRYQTSEIQLCKTQS